jgi:hypothetical protein
MYEGSFAGGINGELLINKNNLGKSFKIFGSHLDSTNYFIDNFEDAQSFNLDYDITESNENDKGPSNWQIVPFPKEEGRSSLTNKSEIEDKKTNPSFGSTIFRKNFDTQNAILRINIFFDNLSSSAMGKAG